MKKFFETPEVSSVELNQTDVIMTSGDELAKANPTGIVVWDDKKATNEQFKMWKGFN